ncbi:MAG: rRNA maturation RNase YbeY [Bacillota bacterium]
MSVNVVFLKKDYLLHANFIKYLTAVLEDLLVENSLDGGEVNLVITGDEELSRLNSQYRGKEGSTDVLSFTYLEPDSGEIEQGEDFAVGDIYISLDRALIQAEEAGVKPEMEVALLAIHGLLHLLGYEHDNNTDAALMRRKERDMLSCLESRLKGD